MMNIKELIKLSTVHTCGTCINLNTSNKCDIYNRIHDPENVSCTEFVKSKRAHTSNPVYL